MIATVIATALRLCEIAVCSFVQHVYIRVCICCSAAQNADAPAAVILHSKIRNPLSSTQQYSHGHRMVNVQAAAGCAEHCAGL